MTDPACSAACGCGYVGGALAVGPVPAPVVTSVLPVAGPAAGGQLVTISVDVTTVGGTNAPNALYSYV
jgi:hypothetical protein